MVSVLAVTGLVPGLVVSLRQSSVLRAASLNPRCVSACVSAQGETITWFLRPAGAQGQLLVRGIRC